MTTPTRDETAETAAGRMSPIQPDEKRFKRDEEQHAENANVVHVREEDFDVYGEAEGKGASGFICFVLE